MEQNIAKLQKNNRLWKVLYPNPNKYIISIKKLLIRAVELEEVNLISFLEWELSKTYARINNGKLKNKLLELKMLKKKELIYYQQIEILERDLAFMNKKCV